MLSLQEARVACSWTSLSKPCHKAAAFTVAFLTYCLFCPARLAAQNPTPPPTTQEAPPQGDSPKPAQAPSPAEVQEVASRDTPATFKVRVNVVLVRVVVRDAQGKVVPSLKKEDFQLFDGKKLQTISSFAVETPQSHTAPAAGSPESSRAIPDAAPVKPVVLPQRFVAMVFDDVHMSMQDTAFVRDSATRFFGALAPSDRVAINSTSGQLTQDFTDDHETLRKALLGILPRPTHVDAACPDMPYYEADLIANRNDIQALGVATQETLQCAFGGDQRMLTTAQAMAQAAAQVAVSQGDNETEFTYRRMEETLRRLTAMPGQRIVVFVSPGFFLTTMENTASDLIDRATRANVVINTIDARGLYTPDSLGDIANPPAETGLTAGYKSTYRITAQGLQDDVLAQLADGTGGSFYHNRNDVEEAMRQAGAAPEISYLLGFSPQNLKADGRYHTLKVSLTSKQKYTLQARHGFYAPRTIADPAEAAKQEIQDALFSQDELLEFPLDFHTQFFKVDPATAKVAVVAHLDIKGLPLRKDAGRNNDRLTIMTGFFDENGQYVTGVQKIVDMKLRDTTYEQLKRMGLNLKTSFDIRPGTYLVRVVVRDSEGAQMAARNGSVVIPN